MVKSHILDFWENKLRGEASMLPSLEYCKTGFIGLATPHPFWTTAWDNPHEVSKAIQQARFLSGRYQTEYLSQHWSTNPRGCFLAGGSCRDVIEDTNTYYLSAQPMPNRKESWFHSGSRLSSVLPSVPQSFPQSSQPARAMEWRF